MERNLLCAKIFKFTTLKRAGKTAKAKYVMLRNFETIDVLISIIKQKKEGIFENYGKLFMEGK